MVLHGQLLMGPLHLLFTQASGQRQTKGLASLDRLKIRITAHRALFTAMVGFSRLAPAFAAAFCTT